MPSRNNRNAQRQTDPEPVTYYRPLLQLDNSPPWTPEQPPLLQLDRPPDSDVQLNLGLVHEVALELEDEGPPIKHEGCLLSITPSSETPPSPAQPDPKARSLTPQSSQGHTRSPVLTR
ncbi:hypothetical protein HYDPIDRAFT_161962 [Hydnomerulius pinastri MD-312]|uniref:Uncharacterized protein n=1 Tax=Hydnomerulius pinastri MD-312 TaxID=994086 RepID=A0A0C9W1I5_9AGAM|nr:hypothetical protein HYDPIDRAFT_161962 [Hydnomerulius pinastri MD-312]